MASGAEVVHVSRRRRLLGGVCWQAKALICRATSHRRERYLAESTNFPRISGFLAERVGLSTVCDGHGSICTLDLLSAGD
jgi:hypothetical protein